MFHHISGTEMRVGVGGWRRPSRKPWEKLPLNEKVPSFGCQAS